MEKVLVAAAPASQVRLEKLLRGCELDFVSTFADGLEALSRHPYRQVVIDVLFADSSMFEFARSVRQMRPGACVICVKVAGRPLEQKTRMTVDSTLKALGYEGIVDLSPRPRDGPERRVTTADRRAHRRMAYGGRRADDRRALLL